MNLILSIISAFFLALSFPKFSLFWLAWIVLVPFFIALNKAKNIKEALGLGLCFGIIFFGINLFWVNSLFRFAGWWVPFGWFGLVLFQTMFILLFVVLFRVARTLNLNAVVISLLWAAIEWLRAFGPFGVTGGDVGYTQVHILPLIQIASFVSVYGISFLVVLVNGVTTKIIMEPANKIRGSLIFVIILIALVYGYGKYELIRNQEFSDRILKIALIQPNIDQKDKMDINLIGATFNIHESLSRQAMEEKPDIIIWPETAVFSYLINDYPLFNRIKKIASDSNAWMVIGTPYYDRVENKSYNSIISINPSGEVISHYDKEKLVPFGEYLPFRPFLFPILKSVGYYDDEFSSNPNPMPLIIDKYKVAAAICFESTFPDMIRSRVKSNSDFILMVTNDAWFGNSSASYFHFETAIFRAIENRKYFVQVGNNGISALIDPWGRILKKMDLNMRGVLTVQIPLP